MEEKLEIGSIIEMSIGKAYDTYCKKILCNKQILAHIMKEYLKEYKQLPLEEIPDYIETTPRMNEMVDDEKIQGMNTEDEKIPGSLIRYDVLFTARIPYARRNHREEKVGLLINIEAQNQDDPSYPLISRAIYYCSRLLARQKNAPEGFHHSAYGDIKKVYSIWICIHHKREKDDVVNTYSITERCLKHKWHSPEKAYDLMSTVMIYLGKHSIVSIRCLHIVVQ